MSEGSGSGGSGSSEDQLRREIEEKDAMLSSLKAKTKLYIQKLQKESTEKLEEERDHVKQLQGKVEAARTYISKQRDESQALTASKEALQRDFDTLKAQSTAHQVFLNKYIIVNRPNDK